MFYGKVVLFNEDYLEMTGKPSAVYEYVNEKIMSGYDQSKFTIFEENSTFETFADYFEMGDEIELEDLQYAVHE